MRRDRLDGLFLFILGSVIFVWIGFTLEHSSPVSMADFKGPYYGARCLLQHADPYQQSELQRVYLAEVQGHPLDPAGLRRVVTVYINLPTGFVLTVPFALFSWGPAHLLWMTVTGASFILAAYLMWELAAEHAPAVSGLLVCIFLINSELLLEIGNAAGISISLCVIAVWCFVKEKFVWVGILCFALSLTAKPHITGLVLLYFLLAGGLSRKRAFQTLAVTIVLGLSATLWVSNVAPHWMQELQANLHLTSSHGDLNDPGPATVDPRFHGALIIDLQSAISIFRDDPRFYNPAAYLICAPLLLVWAFSALRKRHSELSAWLALASISALSMLPLYHRTHDTRLSLLAFPAFAVLWARGGLIAWLALFITGTAATFIGIFPEQLLALFDVYLRESSPGLHSRLLALLLSRPVPLILLAMGIFYLWVYMRHMAPATSTRRYTDAEAGPTVAR